MNFLKFTPSTRKLLIFLKVDDTGEKKVPIPGPGYRHWVCLHSLAPLGLRLGPRPLSGRGGSQEGSSQHQRNSVNSLILPETTNSLHLCDTLQFPQLFCTHASHYSHPVCSWKSAREQIWDCRTLCSIILNGKNNNMSQLIQEFQPITQRSENPFDIYRGCLCHRRHLKHQSPNYLILRELIGEHVCVQYTYGIRFLKITSCFSDLVIK